MDILTQSSLLVAVTGFALGVSVLARNHRNKLFLSFAVLSVVVSLWALSYFLAAVVEAPAFYRLHLFFNIWLAPVGLAFIHVMIRMQDRISRRLFDLAVFSSVVLSVFLAFRLEDNPLVRLLILYSPVYLAAQTFRLMHLDRRLKHGLLRTSKRPTVGMTLGRRGLIYLGAVIVLATSVMDHIPGVGPTIPSLGNVLLSIYLFFLSQAISQQRLMNFEALLTRFFVLLAVALILTGVYWLMAAWISDSPGLFFLNSFIVSFLILMLLDPLRATVGLLTRSLLTQKHRRLETLLRESQRRLAGTVTPDALFDQLMQDMEAALRPRSAALYVLRSEGTKFKRVRAEGAVARQLFAVPYEVLADHPLLEYTKQLRRRGELPVMLDQVLENEMERSASRAERERLASLLQGLKAFEANLLIPLIDRTERPERGDASQSRAPAQELRILGFMVLDVPSPPEPWAGNWGLLHLIYPFFELAAGTLRNLEVYVRQREKERLAVLGEMAAGLAHEIRNPLGAIKGAAQFLDPSADRPESRFLRIIVEETDRLNRVVTQFLDYSKPGSLDFEPVDLDRLAEKTVELVRPGLPPEVTLELSRDAGRPVCRGAGVQIQQILLNFVQNSVTALKDRPGGRITVKTERAGEEVALHVEDNGAGIRREHLDKLFIPFFTTSPSGTGLGLSICQKIAAAHQGRIEVSTEVGSFSRFSVYFPAVEMGADADQAKGVRAEERAREAEL